jgi:hypothetical protein
MLVLRLLLLAALVVAFTGCGGGNDGSSATATTASGTTAAQADHAWKRVVPGADCRCSARIGSDAELRFSFREEE